MLLRGWAQWLLGVSSHARSPGCELPAADAPHATLGTACLAAAPAPHCPDLTWPPLHSFICPQNEVVSILQQQAKIEPGFTQLVWQKLEEQNPEFFR